MKNGLAVGLIVGGIILGVGGGFGVNYMINKPVIETFEQQVAELQASIDAIGPITTLYTVKSTVKPGDLITADMLEEQSVPASFVGANALQDTSQIIDKYAKVAITNGTTITADILMEDDINDEKALYNTVRWYDVVVNTWPAKELKIGTYVDLRIMMPFGEEYIVLSHMRIDGMSDATVRFKMTETEINLYQSALVDYYLNSSKGVILYFTEYLEPGVQKPANVTYKVNEEIMRAMQKNSNLYATAWATVYDATKRSDIEADLVPDEEDIDKTDAERATDINSGRSNWASTIGGGSSSYHDESTEEATEEGGSDIRW